MGPGNARLPPGGHTRAAPRPAGPGSHVGSLGGAPSHREAHLFPTPLPHGERGAGFPFPSGKGVGGYVGRATISVGGPCMAERCIRLVAAGLAVLAILACDGARVAVGRAAAPPGQPEGSWSTRSSMTTERGEVGAAVVEGRVYVVGAYGGATDANEVYDPQTDSWQRRAPLPHGLHHGGTAGLGGKLYVIGGYEAVGGRATNTTYEYNPASDSWRELTPMPSPRGALVCVVFGGTIYAIGGQTGRGNSQANEAYDPGSDSWSTRAPLPTGRDHLAGAEVAGIIHVIGGRSNFDFGRNLDLHEAYDPAWDSWATFAPLPTPRHGLGVVAIGDAIHVVAGGRTPGDSRSGLLEVFTLT